MLPEESKEFEKCFGFSAQPCCQRIPRPDILAFRSGRIVTTPAKRLQSAEDDIAHLCFTDGNTHGNATAALSKTCTDTSAQLEVTQ